ncbi:MAG: isoleucine--tRNA ligase [Bacillota bacterium]|nr:isoleucine--tRNA ligase [Bacillota bacterium]
MRAGLPQREPEIQKRWEEEHLYERVQERARREGRPKFVLHDGPPYANGHVHIGTAMNKILKDMVVRYKTYRGFHSPYVPGWDTHGLPIESRVIKDLNLNRHAVGPVEFRQKCREYALKFLDIQREEFQRLGVWGDWEHPYVTLEPHYEARQIEVFGGMALRGYIYKGLKPVYWCTTCETALAEAEIEYAEKKSASIYVKFPVVEDGGRLGVPLGRAWFLIWTTTPWTIPANLAVCLHPDFEYALVGVGEEHYIVAQELLAGLAEALGWEAPQIERIFSGRELEGIKCRHPLAGVDKVYDRESVVILGSHVTLDAGTGCVHTAPGHGEEDFLVGQKYGLPVLNPVSDQGRFTAEAGKYEGLDLEAGNKAVISDLQAAGALAESGAIRHQFPHCWRCKNPVVFRATEQWFASVDGFRDQALKAIHEVKWYPAWGEERIAGMVAERRDWCISRQRVWGVPIPIFYCTECGEPLITKESLAAVRDLFAREGSDAWFAREAGEILPAGTSCGKCGAGKFRKETDTMDVWFDSGSSHWAVLPERPELAWPCDLYLEGSDQHRGWFQSSLLTAVATQGRAPYREVLTHGYVVDEEGRKMSKSLGNVVAPEEVIKQYGADILRLWVASVDYTDDVGISPNILKHLAEGYRRIRNTARFLLANVADFDPAKDAVPYAELGELDRWALARLARLVARVTEGFDAYQFNVFYRLVHNFCAVDLSAFYLDVLKDRLYTSLPKAKGRRAAQTVLYEILTTLVRLVAPVLVHTAEEIWQHVPGGLPGEAGKAESVHLLSWPEVQEEWFDEELEARWERLLEVRDVVNRALEAARAEKTLGNSLEAAVDVYASPELAVFLKEYEADLPTIFIVSQAALHPWEERPAEALTDAVGTQKVAVAVRRAAGEKCARCWMYAPEVGRDRDYPDVCPRCADVLRRWAK